VRSENPHSRGGLEMSMIIRRVLVEETYDYAVCHMDCWRSAYKGIMPDEYLSNMSSGIESRAERSVQIISESCNPYEYLCVTYDEKMIGKLGFGKCLDEDKGEAGQIYAMYLIDEFWDRGFGRKMMEYALNNLKEMGYDEVVIWVLEENDRARRFYEKFRFETDGKKEELNIGKPLVQVRYVLCITDLIFL